MLKSITILLALAVFCPFILIGLIATVEQAPLALPIWLLLLLPLAKRGRGKKKTSV